MIVQAGQFLNTKVKSNGREGQWWPLNGLQLTFAIQLAEKAKSWKKQVHFGQVGYTYMTKYAQTH